MRKNSYYNGRLTTLILLHLLCVVYSEKSADDYVVSTQSECFSSKRIFSCFRYRVARYIWSIATGHANLFQQDIGPSVSNGTFNFVQLSEPSGMEIFPEARQISGDNELTNVGVWKFLKKSFLSFITSHGIQYSLNENYNFGARIIIDNDNDIVNGEGEVTKIYKFMKRSFEMFVKSHGIQLLLEPESGARIWDLNLLDNSDSPRLKKKKKWGVVLPLIILFKLMKLQMMVMKVMLGIGIIQFLLIIGGISIYYYLKHNTLCKVQPHLVHTHSHLEHIEPEIPYSTFSGSHYGNSIPTYTSGKDWASGRAYNAYNINKPS